MTALEGKVDLSVRRADFPILATEANGHPLAYLDNAATSQKPQYVLDVLDKYWTGENANVHRGVHYLSQRATRHFDDSREKVRVLLNAASTKEVILTKGCTEGINLVATCLTGPSPYRLREGDEILVSTMEHHSNIVPWQLAAERVGASVNPIPITDAGEIDLDAYAHMLASGRVKVVGVVHISNSLGTINPVKEIARMAHEAGALVLVDGAQAGPHSLIDVLDLDADFYTLSCHKIYAPTGVGVLYGKQHLMEALPPYHGGGDMIRTVAFEGTTYADLPAKYEAGTPNVAGVIGLGAAIDYIASVGREAQGAEGGLRSNLAAAFGAIHEQEIGLARYATERLLEIPGLRITGTATEKAGIVSFVLARAHPHDIGTILDQEGIAIRAGHHCCMPLMKRLGVPATARASFAFYNTYEEADRLVEAVGKVHAMFE
ncbi:SufS family cysteine desulfurase [Fimbriimonas ginsengisoli]|uniref:cysteine desulfurase n=1 Tax=Fimbriimonas ginsengisoli Gsoil 348 TaxID=661478 RepID=A0A068NK00_FIMGI|nr:SufS family cysteine desulfurase [Fimbriimonas ginsengisoli]AIE83918.1 cysteine desulfurase SufS [Fimbriimonas ginsengisoli Gsoil 348]